MIDRLIREIDPKVLWHSPLCQRNPVWVYAEYRTPDGVEGRLVYDSSDDDLWFTLSSGNKFIPPYFGMQMNALMPKNTVLVLKDKHRRWNVADFIVGVDERLRWRY